MRASKVDLAVYSGYFQTFFDSQFPEAASQEVNIEGAEAAVLESIIKALYEKEVLASICVPWSTMNAFAEVHATACLCCCLKIGLFGLEG